MWTMKQVLIGGLAAAACGAVLVAQGEFGQEAREFASIRAGRRGGRRGGHAATSVAGVGKSTVSASRRATIAR